MAAIIENQHIAKRSKYSSSRLTNKSASFNSVFMNQFKQEPVRSKKRGPASLFTSKAIKRKPQTQKAKHRVRPQTDSHPQADRQGRASGFSFPIPSVATLAVVAGTVLIALAGLRWENLNIKAPENYAFQPITEDAGRHTTQYAATGVSSIVSPFSIPEPPPELENDPPVLSVAPDTTETDNNISEESQDLMITFMWQQYRVQRGDSVSSIAQRFGVSIGAIIASNEIRNARRLQEGAVLRIPNIDGIPYTIKTGDSLSKISASFNVPLDVILDVNDIKTDVIRSGETIFIPGARMNDMDLRLSLGEMFIYPVQGRHITSRFGMRRDPINGALNFHTGIDLRANIGTTVMAAMDGVVSVTGENRLYGKYIILSHSNGYKTIYAHLNSFSVRQGDRVSQGRKIAESGNTGYSTGPHLHFGIYDRNGKLVNPLDLLH